MTTHSPHFQRMSTTFGPPSKWPHPSQPFGDPLPLGSPAEPEESDDPDEFEVPCTDDAQWEVFISDDDGDPLPEPGDFWIDDPEEVRAETSGMELL